MCTHVGRRERGSRSAASHHRGFTLVELLMVIAIIGLLAGLITAAAWKAIGAANRTRVIVEADSLSTAMEQYKTNFNGYPPNLGSNDRAVRLVAHLRRAFPRYIIPDLNTDGVRDYLDVRQNIIDAYVAAGAGVQPDLDTLDQAETLVFWLGGMPAYLSSTKLAGFSADPSSPFRLTGSRIPGGFEFADGRLVDNDGDLWFEYVPDLSVTTSLPAPYVYFDSSAYASTSPTPPYLFFQYPYAGPPNFGPSGMINEWGVAVPYRESLTSYVNQKKFQIISAGADGIYGAPGSPNPGGKLYPVGTGYEMGDLDNLTNFADGTLEDKQP